MDRVIEGFVYGELSPLASGQISSDAYEQSASEMLNMIPDPRGPAVSRVGVKHKESLQAEVCKIFSFQESPTSSYVCAFTPLSTSIIPSVATHLGPNLLVNGEFNKDLLGWDPKVTGLATCDAKPSKLTLTPGVAIGETVVLQQSLVVPDSSVAYSVKIEGLFRGPTGAEGVRIDVGTTLHAVDLASTILYGDLTYQSIDISIPAPAQDILYLTITAMDWVGYSADDTSSYINCIRVEPTASVPPVTTTLVSVYTASQIKDLKAVRRPNTNKLIILHAGVTPYELDLTAGVWTLTAISFTAMPASWVTGSFPTALTFFQGRSIWAGFRDEPETFVFSVSASPYDLTLGITAADAFSFTIDRMGKIRWVLGTKSLLIGTENSEYKIVPTDADTVIKPGSIQIELQSTHGAGDVLPVLVGVETAFVSADSRAVRAMAYFWEDDGWVAEELSQGSEHITYPSITELDVAINPEPTLWLTLGNGTLAACSYQYKKGGSSAAKRITGWHKHSFRWPIESLTTVQEYGHSIPWVAMKAYVNGVHMIHIGPLDDNVSQYLDDSILRTYNALTTNITGLDHLEGLEVDVLSDSATHAIKTVDKGAIELDEPAQQVNVGLAFTARLVTQPMALITRDGTFRQQLGRWSEMFVYLLNSAFPLLDGIRAEEHGATTRMGYAQRLYTGYTNSTQLGWERDTVLTIEQDLPFPLTVTHVAGKVDKI